MSLIQKEIADFSAQCYQNNTFRAVTKADVLGKWSVFFLHSSRARITLEVYGELSERSKVRHSKCRVPKRNLGFESLTLRQKPSHIKALRPYDWAFLFADPP